MKALFSVLLLTAALVPASALASSVSEAQVLHATFAAFQSPGVLTEDHIRASRELLLAAAREGNETALLVLKRQDQFGRLTAQSAREVPDARVLGLLE